MSEMIPKAAVVDYAALIDKLRRVAKCIYIAVEESTARDMSETCLAAADALLASASVSPPAPTWRPEHLASAMRKMLPPALLAEVIAHLDPLTPFVEFLRSMPDDDDDCREAQDNTPSKGPFDGVPPPSSPSPAETGEK